MHLLFNSPYCRKFLFKLPSIMCIQPGMYMAVWYQSWRCPFSWSKLFMHSWNVSCSNTSDCVMWSHSGNPYVTHVHANSVPTSAKLRRSILQTHLASWFPCKATMLPVSRHLQSVLLNNWLSPSEWWCFAQAPWHRSGDWQIQAKF